MNRIKKQLLIDCINIQIIDLMINKEMYQLSKKDYQRIIETLNNIKELLCDFIIQN